MRGIYLLLILIIIASCTSRTVQERPIDLGTYTSEIETWHQKRVEGLKGPSGWLNLAGLFWLHEGVGDATNTKETYGAGRYLYVKKPDAHGKTIIDFNKAYNPPCAFTAFATCPLPPKQNILNLEVAAGEKNYGSYH